MTHMAEHMADLSICMSIVSIILSLLAIAITRIR